MIYGTGVDIIEIHRMKEAVDKWGKIFLGKIFTKREIRYSSSRRFASQHLAARFAAKEAVVKAFGEGRRSPVKWTDIEILNDREGKPVVMLHDSAVRLRKKRRVGDIIISMSHSKDYAVANAILMTGRR